jgi:thiol-disulfide isomerase/thioredoxin
MKRRGFLAASGATVAGTAGCLGSGGGSGSGESPDGTGSDGSDGSDGADGDWRSATFTDVRSDETFSIDSLASERPVLLETFAVWCSTCLRQQKQLRALHEQVGDDVVSVALDVDPNEDAQKVRNHLEKHGFDWRYAVAPAEVTQSLIDQFGQSIAHPPSAPVVLVCADGSRRLKDGVKSAETLEQQVADGC